MKNIFKITFLVFIVFCLLYIISPVQAQILGNEYLTNFGETAGYGGAPLPQVIGRIVKIVLSLLGLIAVIIMIVGGFVWMTSGGVVDKVTKAKKIISSGLIGLLIIVFAYTIVSFVMGRLSGVTGIEPGGTVGCTPSLCCGPGLRCDSGGSCNLSDSSCGFPSDIFKIKKIETTHGGYQENYNQDVYLCSAVQPIFNHSVDSQRIEELELAEELRIETGTNSVSGDWQTRDGAIIFKHDANFTENTSYEAYFPKVILNTQSKILQQCLAAGGCVDAGSYFIWNFQTGEEIDANSPEITSTYPIFDTNDADYPDQNVSQKPNIEVNFSEPIDITTVSDEDNYPINTNVWIAEIEEQSGEIIETLTKDIFEVGVKSNGFRIRLREDNSLKPFTWYKIHIENIEDLCLNSMSGPVEWEFQTNNQAPGISSQYPIGDKVCPDTDINIVFNTQMYDNLVRFEITGDDDFIFEIRPSELDTPYIKEVVGGIFKVADFADPVNNHFKVFTFNPEDDLQSDSDYQVTVTADLVIDQQGNTLSHIWDFATTVPEDCFCSPWISHLKPAQGSKGECLTLYGQCFMGTPDQPAEPTKLEFILSEISTDSSIDGFGNNYLTTQVPNLYSEGSRPEIQMTIEYDTEDQLISNLIEFYINSDDQANGPCLFSINPLTGYSGETTVNLSGIRFGIALTGNQVLFYNNKSAVYQAWGDELVEDALVPLGTEDGLVYLENDEGMSNSLPFDVLQHQGGPGQICQEMINCPSNPPYTCLSPVYDCMHEATDTCRCCCNVSTNSCENSLDCMANQGDCTGIDRGLCCGCQNDTQCSGSLGCGMLDPNKCCYSRPAVSIKSPTGTDVCLNTAIVVKFNQEMDINSLNKNNIKLTKVSTEENIDFNLIKDSADNSFILYPDGCLLDFETQYKVDLIGGVDGNGIRSKMGASMDHSDWNFTTGTETNFCAVDYIKVSPDTFTVESLNNDVKYTSYGYDNNDTSADIKDDISVCISEFNWQSEDVKIAIVNPGKGLQTSVSPVGGEGKQSTDISAAILGKFGIGEFISILSPPVINSLSPDSGTNNLNFPTYITISGNNFGDEQEDSYIEFDSYQAEIGCQNWSNNEIVAIVPSDLELGESYSVTVTNPDQGQSNKKSFEVKDEFHPAICQLRPNQGEAETLITIEGVSFNAQQGDGYVIFSEGGISPQTIDEIETSNWFNTEIIINVPEVPEAIASVVVYVPSPITEENGALKPSNAVSFYQPQNLVQVIEDSTCSGNTPSPSPRYLSSQVCLNSLISARFNIKVKNLLSNNIIVEKCNSGDGNFDNTACSLVDGDISLFSFNEQGFIYAPDDLLVQNNWYQVTLKSGSTGIIDLFNDYQLDGNKNGIEDGSPNDDYIWYFKTKDESEICLAKTIEIIQPDPIGVIIYPGTKDYFALPIGQDCQILKPDTFTWDWKSTKPIVATVEKQPLDYMAIATAVDLGETEIEVIATPSEGESTTNSVDLVVTTEPNVESFQPSGLNDACPNLVIKATFDQLMDRNSLSKENIKVYKKKTGGTDWENIDSISISTFDKDFPTTNIISDPEKDERLLYSDDATALQYCIEHSYLGFTDYTTTNQEGRYKIYTNNGWEMEESEFYIGTLTCYHEKKKTIVNINAGLLGFEKEYKVTIFGDENGVKSIYGVEMLTDYSSNFITSNEICTLSKVTIDKKIINFTATGESKNLNASTYDNKNQEILGIPDVYDWTWLWESSDSSVVRTADSILKSEEITAQNRNGKVQITAKATPTYGDAISGYSNVDVFICENPWPIYQDSETNFELRYCIDKIIDKVPEPLPELSAVAIPGEVGNSLIKEFLFSVGESGDVIGLKIFDNKRRLSILNWYEDPYEGVPNPGNPRTFVIDNYYALQEGRTVYVGATNLITSDTNSFSSPQHSSFSLYSDDTTARQYCIEDQGYNSFESYTTGGSGGGYIRYNGGSWDVSGAASYISAVTCTNTEISPYIYLISHNDNAKSDTLNIYNQLLDNWEFNTNLDNYEDKIKIQNDLLRFYDFQEIKNKLDNYYQSSGKYPTLGAGTYKSGRTNSLWSSWQNTLAKDLEGSLPNDPINKFNGSCSGCVDEPDLQCNHTCYNPINRIFEIPNGSHLYQYYAPDDSNCWGEYYTLSVNLEYGNGGIIWKGEENEDIITSQADKEGDSNYIYKSLGTPVCGDGIVQCGEECDCCGNDWQPCQETETTCEDLGYKGGGVLVCNNCLFLTAFCLNKPDGEKCSPGDICESGYCVDGVCCEEACNATCEYCGDGHGFDAGECHLITEGEDPNNECSNTNGCLTGNCDGHGTCQHAYKDDSKHNCEICKTCDPDGECSAITDSGSTPLDSACTGCKKCSDGECVNQNEDLFDDCEETWNFCIDDCTRRGANGFCDGSGSCDLNSREGTLTEFVCIGYGNLKKVSESNYCGSCGDVCAANEECRNGDCCECSVDDGCCSNNCNHDVEDTLCRNCGVCNDSGNCINQGVCAPNEARYYDNVCQICNYSCEWIENSTKKCNEDLYRCSGDKDACETSCLNKDTVDFCCISGDTSCFTAETLIKTGENEKQIKDIKIDDLISGYNLETKKIEKVKVLKTFKHQSSDYYIIKFADFSTLKTTDIHPLYSENGYVQVKNLNIWNKVGKIKNNQLEFIRIVNIQKSLDKQIVYNLEVDEFHNYFANGFLAHNKNDFCALNIKELDDKIPMLRVTHCIDCNDVEDCECSSPAENPYIDDLGNCICELDHCDDPINGEIGETDTCSLPHAVTNQVTCLDTHPPAWSECTIKSCKPGYGDCNDEAGCETYLNTDVDNCGYCDYTCELGPYDEVVCDNGICIGNCANGRTNCSGSCVDTNTDKNNCGTCSNVCNLNNAVSSCSAGQCVIESCFSNYLNCDGIINNGCEINKKTNPEYCGGCGNNCTNNALAFCADGECVIDVCLGNYENCDDDANNGCEVDLKTNPEHCGDCKNNCIYNAEASCIDGECVLERCFSYYGDCDGNPNNGCEVDLYTNPEHCGDCNNDCNELSHVSFANCVNETCVIKECDPFWKNCDNNWETGCNLYVNIPQLCGLCERDFCSDCRLVNGTTYSCVSW